MPTICTTLWAMLCKVLRNILITPWNNFWGDEFIHSPYAVQQGFSQVTLRKRSSKIHITGFEPHSRILRHFAIAIYKGIYSDSEV